MARVDAADVTMLDQSPHQLARSRAEAGAGGVPAGAGRRRGAAVRRRRLRPLRLGRLDRVLAGPAARDRRGVPRDARRRDGAGDRPGAPGEPRRPRAGRGVDAVPARRGVHALDGGRGLHGRARARAGAGLVPRPARARTRSRSAASSPRRARRRRAARAAAEEPRSGPLRFAARFVLGSAAGAAFVPIARRAGAPRRWAGAPRDARGRARRAARPARRPRRRSARGAPRRAPALALVLWRFSRPHTIIGTALSIVGLYAIAAAESEAAARLRPRGHADRRPDGQHRDRRRQPDHRRRDRPDQQAVAADRRRRPLAGRARARSSSRAR